MGPRVNFPSSTLFLNILIAPNTLVNFFILDRGGALVQEGEAEVVRLHRRRHGRDEHGVRNLPHHEPDLSRQTRAAGKP